MIANLAVQGRSITGLLRTLRSLASQNQFEKPNVALLGQLGTPISFIWYNLKKDKILICEVEYI